jgi:tRNA1Val (adenine37-N6)-methyltransferase
MPNDYFQFKQFLIRQDRCAMKVGTDGVLLGAWTDVAGAETILDIGTGTGLIALMLAQRSTAPVDAIEIDEAAAEQACENVAASPWKDRIQVSHITLQSFTEQGKKYDLIVSNPPFFSNSLRARGDQRSLARHSHTLSLTELITGVSRLLSSKGRFALIWPAANFSSVVQVAASCRLFPLRQTRVIPAPGKPVKRILAEFTGKQRKTHSSELIIEQFGRHKYSQEYKDLTGDFYL